jgi:uncharacterized protein (UPF0548 family)
MTEPWQMAVTYGAVGGTQASDMMQYPPTGYRPVERRARIGHGDARFEFAWSEMMTWGIQKRSGFKVVLADTPSEVSEQAYTPVRFDENGEPITPPAHDPDIMFGADGTPFVKPGDTGWLIIPVIGPLGIKSPVRVVYVIDEPKRKGFAYGTLPGHPEDGEAAFVVEQRDDESVWLTIRSFSRPANWFWWMGYPVMRMLQSFYTNRYLRALAAPL